MDNENQVVEEETTTTSADYPEWLVNLIERLTQVLTKLLLKFGIKLAF